MAEPITGQATSDIPEGETTDSPNPQIPSDRQDQTSEEPSRSITSVTCEIDSEINSKVVNDPDINATKPLPLEVKTNEGDTEVGDKAVLQVLRSPTVRFSNSPKGENSEEVEVIEYTDTEMIGSDRHGTGKCCGTGMGPHIILFTLFCIPVALFISLVGAFYYGALTWYNLLSYFSEERTMWHKIFLCPIVILTFPFTVGLTSLGIAIYAAFKQISWYFISWRQEIVDLEKGFYGWLCDKLHVPMCSPYDVMTFNEDSELEAMRT